MFICSLVDAPPQNKKKQKTHWNSQRAKRQTGSRWAQAEWKDPSAARHVWRMFSTRWSASLATAVQTADPGRSGEGGGGAAQEWAGGGGAASLAKVRQTEAAGSVGTVREGMCEMLRDEVSSYSQNHLRENTLCRHV